MKLSPHQQQLVARMLRENQGVRWVADRVARTRWSNDPDPPPMVSTMRRLERMGLVEKSQLHWKGWVWRLTEAGRELGRRLTKETDSD